MPAFWGSRPERQTRFLTSQAGPQLPQGLRGHWNPREPLPALTPLLAPARHSTGSVHQPRLLPALSPGAWGEHCSYLHTPPQSCLAPSCPTWVSGPIAIPRWGCLLVVLSPSGAAASFSGHLWERLHTIPTPSQGFAHKGQGERMPGSRPLSQQPGQPGIQTVSASTQPG